MNYLNEKFVKKAIIKWLSRKGYNLALNSGEVRDHGVDIKVRHKRYGRDFLVETKGDANPKTNKNPDSTREVYFNCVLGQIVSRMEYRAKYWYAIGLPYTYKKKVIRRLPKEVCKNLRLKILLVNKDGKVEELNWRHLKNK